MNEEQAHLAAALHTAFPPPAPPPVPMHDFVTRAEFQMELKHLETKIENVTLKIKNWVLVGVGSIILAFGGGYVSVISKLDRMAETLPSVSETATRNRTMIQHQEQRDRVQDDALRRLDRQYEPPSYDVPAR